MSFNDMFSNRILIPREKSRKFLVKKIIINSQATQKIEMKEHSP